jgi:hypothetical protein
VGRGDAGVIRPGRTSSHPICGGTIASRRGSMILIGPGGLQGGELNSFLVDKIVNVDSSGPLG